MSRSAPSGAGATATRRREPTSLRPQPAPPLGAASRGDEVARVLELFDTRYWDFTAKIHEKLVADHGFKRSYNWLRLSLQAHGRRRAAPRRGATGSSFRVVRCPACMKLHQDGSSREWVPGRWWDLMRHQTLRPAISVSLTSSPRGHHRTSSACRGDPGQGPCSARSTPTVASPWNDARSAAR